MTWHHDLGWWGFVISIVALVAAYPLDLLAHMTSPRIKNWWAERSVRSLQMRIDKIEKQLAKYDHDKELSDGEYYLLKASEGLALLMGLCVNMVALVLILIVSKGEATLTGFEGVSKDKIPVAFVALLGALTAFFIGTLGFRPFSKLREERSAIGRAATRKNLEELKQKLLTRKSS
jgi:hypothetical protein